MSRLRVGIIGAGWVARHRHVPAYRRTGRATVTAVFDRRADRAAALAKQAKAQPWTDLEGMLDSGLDAVSVCTPPWLHAEHAQAALRRGIHVLCEKPMATTVADCEAMEAAAHGARLAVAHNFLFSRAVSRVRREVASGRAGSVRSFLGFQMSTPRRRLPDWYGQLPGQLFFDEAPHLTYLAQGFCGRDLEVRSAHASAGHADDVQRTQQVVSTLQQGTGPLASIHMTFNASRAEWGFALVGSRRSYLVDLFRDIVVPLGLGGRHTPWEVLAQSMGSIGSAGAGVMSSGTLFAARRLSYGHGPLVSAWCRALAGEGDVPVMAEAGKRCIQVLEETCRIAGLSPGPRHAMPAGDGGRLPHTSTRSPVPGSAPLAPETAP